MVNQKIPQPKQYKVIQSFEAYKVDPEGYALDDIQIPADYFIWADVDSCVGGTWNGLEVIKFRVPGGYDFYAERAIFLRSAVRHSVED